MRAKTLLSVLLVGLLTLFLAPAGALPQGPGEVDIDELINEIQQPVRGKNYAGVVWWIPVEFWETTARQDGTPEEVIAEQMAPLRDYTMVAIAVGKIGPFGSIEFVPPPQIRANVLLRDSRGVDYPPLDQVGQDATLLASAIRPILSSAIGRMGENMEVVFFAARNEMGQPLADPTRRGSFTIVLRDIAGPGEGIYEWKLPLSSLLPPKFCPVGGERVKANWNYCPWHGSRLYEGQ